ncbi:MAG: hypothetical protein HFACDABA_00499 [Anaerolineales bacterium]|nr:hypothetical protein [Anaerolineales bacterium]
MNRIFDIVLVLLFSGIALISLLGAVAVLFPRPVEKARDILTASFWKSFLLGLVNFLFFGALVALLARFGQRAYGALAAVLLLLALLLALALTAFLLIGLSALTNLAGERIGEGSNSFRRHLRGSLLIVLAGLTPYVGWFAFAPVMLITSLGAGIQAWFRKEPKVAA